MLEGNLRGQSRMNNPEKLCKTQDEDKQNKRQDTRRRQTKQKARHRKLI
jgi:hypothetical protein